MRISETQNHTQDSVIYNINERTPSEGTSACSVDTKSPSTPLIK